ncbi:MAG TPA: transketolase C-terminal domain-containing protein [Candidatus Acidoferrales bacterium]|jgi:transketolase|nr:transketolase C-terminal domain-containing protein [Candidatus Acidoferrales bacterium]
MFTPAAKAMAAKLGLAMGRANLEEFAATLEELAKANPNIVAVTSDSRGSGKLAPFGKALPKQIVEVGIAEQNLVGITAGLAACGKKSFGVSPSCFLTARSLEQIKNDICYSDVPAVLVGISSGTSYGALGTTHHSLHDLAVLRAINNLTIIVPADNFESRHAILTAAKAAKPVFIRFGKAAMFNLHKPETKFETGKAITLREGNDVAFIATGETVVHALLAAGHLVERGLNCRVISMHSIKPLDTGAIVKAGRECRAIITVEEHMVNGGLGEACAAVLLQAGVNVPFQIVGLPDEETVPGAQADIFRHYGISMEGLSDAALNLLGVDDKIFLEQFESTAWPYQKWRHRQHIKVAYLYLRRYPLAEAQKRISQRIRAFNASKGVAESLTGGFHETMTQAWMHLVHYSLCEYGAADTADAFYDQNPQLWGKKVLRYYYTKETYVTEKAKAEFVPPDVTPFPKSKKTPPPLIP